MLLVIFSVCEFENFCLPDALPVTYQSAYVLSFLGVIIVRVAQGLSGQDNNFFINAVYFNVINISVVVMYAIDVFIWNPVPLSASMEDNDNRSSKMHTTKLLFWEMFQSHGDAWKSALYDVFSMSRSAGSQFSTGTSTSSDSPAASADGTKSEPLMVR